MKSVLVAFSGGVDSTFVAFFAKKVLRENVLCVYAKSPIHPKDEEKEAEKVAKYIGVELIKLETDELLIDDFLKNSKARCYFCKRNLFSKLLEIARKRGLKEVLDGSNKDDLLDFRPGQRALLELGIKSLLISANLGKDDIRNLSRKFGLPNWDKPQDSCLATRIPYGRRIDRRTLKRIEEAEKFLKSLKISLVRVRDYGDVAKIEVAKKDIEKIISNREIIISYLKGLGYFHISLDLEGYRRGSINESDLS